MRITYDSKARAAYVYLGDHVAIWKTQRISNTVLLDMDKGANVVGIEILDVDAPVVEDITGTRDTTPSAATVEES